MESWNLHTYFNFLWNINFQVIYDYLMIYVKYVNKLIRFCLRPAQRLIRSDKHTEIIKHIDVRNKVLLSRTVGQKISSMSTNTWHYVKIYALELSNFVSKYIYHTVHIISHIEITCVLISLKSILRVRVCKYYIFKHYVKS